jgi:hypothetical protein
MNEGISKSQWDGKKAVQTFLAVAQSSFLMWLEYLKHVVVAGGAILALSLFINDPAVATYEAFLKFFQGGLWFLVMVCLVLFYPLVAVCFLGRDNWMVIRAGAMGAMSFALMLLIARTIA